MTSENKSRRQFLQLAAASAAGAALLPAQDVLATGLLRRMHFVFVHGAWFGSWAWYKIVTNLERLGHTVTAVNLPAHSVDMTPAATITLQSYADRVLQVIDAATDPVVLVGHSLGGITVSTVAEARPQSLSKLIYLSAFLLQDGQNAVTVAGADTDSTIGPILQPDPANGVIGLDPSGVTATFFGHTDARDITLARSLYRPDPIVPFVTPVHVTQANFGSVRRFYISCLDDKAISPASQQRMLDALPCEAVLRIFTDHSAFLSAPEILTAELLSIAFR